MALTKEEKKQLKSDRVKKVFAETAREMIHEAGVESVSVRKVADRAGYSLGTVYNHFKNQDELLWETREIMILDVAKYMIPRNPDMIESIDDIKAVFRLFANYFVENPLVYRFFYYHELNKEDRPNTNFMDDPEVRAQFGKTFDYLVDRGMFSPEEVAIRSRLVVYAMFGMLTLYITNNDDLTLEELYQSLDDTVDRMFG